MIARLVPNAEDMDKRLANQSAICISSYQYRFALALSFF